MGDKTLLELAAKAAGIDGWFVEPHENNANLWWGIDSETENRWNPLTDDGDALRLAVKLGVNVSPGQQTEFSRSRFSVAFCDAGQILEERGDDPYAATRRAIVRAAAEIGKASDV